MHRTTRRTITEKFVTIEKTFRSLPYRSPLEAKTKLSFFHRKNFHLGYGYGGSRHNVRILCEESLDCSNVKIGRTEYYTGHSIDGDETRKKVHGRPYYMEVFLMPKIQAYFCQNIQAEFFRLKLQLEFLSRGFFHTVMLTVIHSIVYGCYQRTAMAVVVLTSPCTGEACTVESDQIDNCL